jgi:hypothetical protein
MVTNLLKDIVFYKTVSSSESIIEEEMGFSALHSLATRDFESSIKVQVLGRCYAGWTHSRLALQGIEARCCNLVTLSERLRHPLRLAAPQPKKAR